MPIPGQGAIDTLELAQAYRIRQIDQRTRTLARVGFSYLAKTFSMSVEARMTILDHRTAVALAIMAYPITVETIDGMDVVSLANQGDADAFFAACQAALAPIAAGEHTAKANVRAAATINDALTAVDPRE